MYPQDAAERSLKVGTPRIVGGDVAAETRYPYTVSLWNYGSFYCTGSLVAPDMVLFAVHCSAGSKRSEVYINRFDHNDPNLGSGPYEVAQVFKHPLYNGFTKQNDVALLKLKTTSSEPTVKLNMDPNIPAAAGTEVHVMGWGRTVFGEDSHSDELKVATTEYMTNDECNAVDPYEGRIADDMLCSQLGNGDACHGKFSTQAGDKSRTLVLIVK